MTLTKGGATYKVWLPLDEPQMIRSPRGDDARAWRRHWKILVVLCKDLKKSGVRYEVEYRWAAPKPYVTILAGDACRRMVLPAIEVERDSAPGAAARPAIATHPRGAQGETMADKKAPKANLTPNKAKAAEKVKPEEAMNAERSFDLLKGYKMPTPELQAALDLQLTRCSFYLARKRKHDKEMEEKRAAKAAKKAATVKTPAAKAALRIRKA